MNGFRGYCGEMALSGEINGMRFFLKQVTATTFLFLWLLFSVDKDEHIQIDRTLV